MTVRGVAAAMGAHMGFPFPGMKAGEVERMAGRGGAGRARFRGISSQARVNLQILLYSVLPIPGMHYKHFACGLADTGW